MTYGNSATTNYGFDLGNRLTGLTHNLTSTDSIAFTYGYNNVNQRTSTTASDISYLYAHTDNQGSVMALTDQPRNLRGLVTYDPWGDSGNINTSVFGFGYTGQRFGAK